MEFQVTGKNGRSDVVVLISNAKEEVKNGRHETSIFRDDKNPESFALFSVNLVVSIIAPMDILSVYRKRYIISPFFSLSISVLSVFDNFQLILAVFDSFIFLDFPSFVAFTASTVFYFDTTSLLFSWLYDFIDALFTVKLDGGIVIDILENCYSQQVGRIETKYDRSRFSIRFLLLWRSRFPVHLWEERSCFVFYLIAITPCLNQRPFLKKSHEKSESA